jgi:hypothetical protein
MARILLYTHNLKTTRKPGEYLHGDKAHLSIFLEIIESFLRVYAMRKFKFRLKFS